mmetsp:Transcript_35313/g.105472  ORF Transcript_35313/g.105472 Transcript_35313/m.105472 type:complete len:897 (-) Transcript_35313:19-2709(-)
MTDDNHRPLTRVNGIGLWNSWTRNFKTPLLALLDLFDNSIDAAFVAPPSEPEGTAPGMLGCGSYHDDGGVGSLQSAIGAATSAVRPNVSVSRPASSARAFRGKIYVEPDEWIPPSPDLSNSANVFSDGEAAVEAKITGVKMVNNSSRPIKSLGRIMEVYSSSKGRAEHGAITEEHMHEDFAETIGENGVGLKQGCATLSDQSFVLMRNGNKLGLGVIAARLQSAAGVYLPHVDFESSVDNLNCLRGEITNFFLDKKNGNVKQCAEHYGEGNLGSGVERLLQHFVDLSEKDGVWGNEENVFCVVLHHLKHGKKTYAPKRPTASTDVVNNADEAVVADAVDAGGSDGGGWPTIELDGSDPVEAVDVLDAIAVDAVEAENVNEEEKRPPPPRELTPDERYADHAISLLQEIRDELPRNYIHISSLMEVRIMGEDVRFHYWQRRLVELTSYTHIIDPVNSFTEAEDWKKPKKGYPIRIFFGFDSVRLTSDHHARGQCSLYIYSRLSGRLIKHEEDARALLKLSSGGSHFSQGLTVIVDDADGNLPLNPTKQDVAFGEQAHGDVHKRNLYSWLGAITNAYYTFHLEANCGSKKGVLTRKVRAFGTPVIDPNRISDLDHSETTHMEEINWKLFKGGSIRIPSKKGLIFVPGSDTVRRFKADPPRERVMPSRKRKHPEDGQTTSHYFEKSGDKDTDEKTVDNVVSPVRNGDPMAESHEVTDDTGDSRVSMSPQAATRSSGSSVRTKCPDRVRSRSSSKKPKTKRDSVTQHPTDDDLSSHEGNAALHLEIKGLREAVEKHKAKSQERKKLARTQDATIKQLKAKIKELNRAKKEQPSPGKKSTKELVLEEQCDQLAAVAAAAKENEEEFESTIQELQEKLEKQANELNRTREELATLKENGCPV